MLEIILIVSIIIVLPILVVGLFANRSARVDLKNVDHIEMGPRGPIFKTRLDYESNFIKPTGTQNGYQSYLGVIQ